MSELERLTDINMWKASKIDLILNHQFFNILDELLEMMIVRMQKL
jgi:hypothetical protein